MTGAKVLRPRVGLSPTSPQLAAGARGGDAGGVPRVAGGPVEPGLTGEREADLAAVGAAEDHEAGPLEPGHVFAVERGRRGVGEEPAAPRHGRPGERGAQVLQQKRHAAERPVGKPVGDRAAAVVVERHDHRVHLRVARFHPGDRGLEQLGGRHLAAPHEVGQPEGVVLLVVREAAHGAPVYCFT